MILNKKQMQEARLLASYFVKIENEKQAFKNALEAVGQIYESVKHSVAQAWETILDSVSSIFDKKTNDDDLRDSWHVPVKIKAPPMPDIPMPRMMNIRSDL